MKTKKKKIKASSSQSHHTDSEPSDLKLHTAAVKIAVAQICKSVGYKAAQTSALETLTAVTVNYLMSLAKSAATFASSTGRTECNLYDVIRALEDLHADIGFTGNSDLKKRLCLLSDSSILRDMMKFVYLSREIPFAKPLPRRRYTVPANSPYFGAESVKWKHIPRWLPEFPKVVDGGGTTVAPAASGDETGCEKKFVTKEFDRKVDKLPEKRKKVSFRIGCGGRRVIKMKSGGDLRSGMCKRGKRVLCEIYEDTDDEKIVNDSCSGNDEVKVIQYTRRKKKKKLQE
ncbi:putative transcription factor Hap3/NF-YB family [Helianthus annuus]|uniref:Bromodomain associated domain, histone-fold protein n=1 Tax=Helianthus annuus TaxID=4232 RepID=A0A251UG90_HELAN|nr:uncharacterized protein LOC110864370 [Helianthus annuus]KAF5800742.1 putative bromodomain associated domain, histone-fold protein [Helianthus annuus]KAJ0572072.1 putative transcription factor Hap3/NF-YB family [Helianthus annuus]KAJ0736533.1 putative transcription factor Hap3/NF-YB family [Helianthus annuus]KAJ0910161.1 putative transcription factor Hap3/NF-YB family [Helianthus annuus]